MNVRRRDLLRSAPFALPELKSRLAQAAAPDNSAAVKGMNVTLFLTDQELPVQVQDHVDFTYGDVRCAQNVPQLVPPNRVVSIREARCKLARYYDGAGSEPDQWEMYDLETDPHERVNLAFPGSTFTAE